MDIPRFILPVSTSVQELLTLEDRIRTSDPHTNVLQAMPPSLRDRIILQLEFMGLNVGQIRTAFAAVNPNSDARKKERERNRQAWEYMLAVVQRYITTYSETAFVVVAAKLSVNKAIGHLDMHIKQIEAMGPVTTLAKRTLRDIKNRKADLENFRDVTLEKHVRTLENNPAPKESELENIQQDVEQKISEEPFARRFFGQLQRFAPTVIRDFIHNNTTRKIFQAVSRTLSHAENQLPEESEAHLSEPPVPQPSVSEAFMPSSEAEAKPEAAAQAPLPGKKRSARTSRRRIVFKTIVAGLASTIYMAYSNAANSSLKNRWNHEAASVQTDKTEKSVPYSYCAQSADFPYNAQNPYARYARTPYAPAPHPGEAFRPVTVESGDYENAADTGFAESYAYAAGDGDDGGEDQGDIRPPSREVA